MTRKQLKSYTWEEISNIENNIKFYLDKERFCDRIQGNLAIITEENNKSK